MSIIGDGIMLGNGGETASIVVTAPTGSTVTCTTSIGIVLTASEINGTWTFAKLKNYGTYTITATDGTKTATRDVVVDSASEYTVEMGYKLWLYKDGDECEDVTGGWSVQQTSGKGTVTKRINNITIVTYTDGSPNIAIETTNNISASVLNNYSKLCVDYSCTLNNKAKFGLTSDVGQDPPMLVYARLPLSATHAEVDLTTVTISESYYVCLSCWVSSPNANNVVVSKIWLE